MGKNNTLLILLAGGAALLFIMQQKKNGNGNGGGDSLDTMSEAEAALRIKQEDTKQKELELDYLKAAGERNWEDVALDFFGGAAKAGGTALGGMIGQIKI
jgi:hypothetical protein